AAGNVGTIATQAYTLDTSAPTKTVGSIAISADAGSSSSDFVTSTASQTITATLSGALSAASGGASAEELWGSVDGGTTWTNITSSVSGTAVSWATTLSAGASSIKLAVRDAAGNVGTIATQSYTLDTSAPTKTVSSIAISADVGSSNSDFVTSTASQTITATLSGALSAA